MKSAWVLAGTAVAAGFMAVQAQQAIPSGGRKIEFSDPGGSVVASNLNTIGKTKAAFPSLGNDLKRPVEIFQPGSSLQGIGGPLIQRAPVSAANSKKLKELMEKRQDWQFLELEDYHSEQTIEEMLGISEYGPKGEFKEEKTPLERYYQRLERATALATNRGRNDASFSLGFGFGKRHDGSREDSDLRQKDVDSGELSEVGDPWRQLLRSNPGNSWFPDNQKPTGFSPVFGQTQTWKTEPSETTRAQAAHVEEFKRILETQTLPSLPSSSVAGIAPFDPFKPPGSAAPTFALPRSPEPKPVVSVAPFAPARDSLSPLPTAAGLVARPLELPELSTGIPNLSPAAPLPEPTRTVAPPAEFSIPKRRFP